MPGDCETRTVKANDTVIVLLECVPPGTDRPDSGAFFHRGHPGAEPCHACWNRRSHHCGSTAHTGYLFADGPCDCRARHRRSRCGSAARLHQCHSGEDEYGRLPRRSDCHFHRGDRARHGIPAFICPDRDLGAGPTYYRVTLRIPRPDRNQPRNSAKTGWHRARVHGDVGQWNPDFLASFSDPRYCNPWLVCFHNHEFLRKPAHDGLRRAGGMDLRCKDKPGSVRRSSYCRDLRSTGRNLLHGANLFWRSYAGPEHDF